MKDLGGGWQTSCIMGDEQMMNTRSGVVMCANANDNQAVFSVSHYRVYYIDIRTI